MYNSIKDNIVYNFDLTSKTIANDTYKLLTIEILYYLPDYPSILQTFVLQKLDLHPNYPELNKFLDFWSQNIEAQINSVTISASEINNDKLYGYLSDEITLH
ncbi:MAG: hypothetical protein J0H68_04200 [Sphingobacteriia bacterium]|nr:hypothetical protein [Sphingobacteriia bacterium]